MNDSLRDLPYCVHTADLAASYNEIRPNPCQSVNQLVDLRAKTHADRLATGFPAPDTTDGNWSCLAYTFSALRDASVALARHYAAILPPQSPPGRQSTIALMCPSGPDYLITVLACIRLGIGVLLLAPQLNTEAVRHLLRATECVHILAHQTLKQVADEVGGVQVIDLLPVQDSGATTDEDMGSLTPEEEAERVAIVFHSSGSSGMPKPIPVSHRLMTTVMPCCPSSDDGKGPVKAAFTTTPLFHGGMTDLFRALNALEPIYFFPLHALPVTAANIERSLDCIDPGVIYFFTVPYILKLLLEAGAIDILKRMSIVSTGGAPLSDELGDELVSEGVPLVSRYGSSECGFLLSSHRKYASDKAWQWLREPHDTALGRFREFRMIDESTAELIIHKGWPHQIISNRPDGSYATGDLFNRHEIIPHAWRYAGRADDILVMINGEKTDPAPLEAHLRASPLVKEAVVFGSNRPATGVLILLASAEMQQKPPEQIVEAMWPHVCEANKLAPAHSQIFREMVVPLRHQDAEKGFPTSSKGTIQRQQVYATFETLIDRTYEAFENAGTNGGQQGDRPNETELYAIIREVITATLGGNLPRPLNLETDLFVFGINSLHSARIRNVLQKRLDLGDAKLGSNIVYEKPTIRQLARHILQIREGRLPDGPDHDSAHVLMHRMVDKYSNFTASSSNGIQNGFSSGTSQSVYLLTGATGALGSYLLPLLLSDPCCSVICLVRAKDDRDARKRVQSALQARAIPELDGNSSARLKCFASQLGEPLLGLPLEHYTHLRSKVTCIIHLAWAVNFVASLESFETDHVAGLHSLGQLAIDSARHPTFLFGSSVASVLGKIPPDGLVHEHLPSDDAAQAPPMGYSRSKWVAEHLCQRLAAARVSTCVLRIGQLCGDTRNGLWNESEGWPLMLKSARFTGCLPEIDEPLDWLPVDSCAQAILEIARTFETRHGSCNAEVLHVLNADGRTTWMDWLSLMKANGGTFDTVDVQEWLRQLEESEPDECVNPSRKLLEVWRKRVRDCA